MDGLLMSSGNQKDKYIEHLERNSKYLRRNELMIKIISSFFAVVMDIFVIFTFDQFQKVVGYISPSTFDGIIFAFASSLNMIFFTKLIFLLTLSLTSLMGIFSGGNAFKLLEILPFTGKDRGKIIIFTLYRSINLQLIVMFLGFPTATIVSVIIFGGSWLMIPFAFIVSALNISIVISLLIIISNFMANRIFNFEETSRLKNIVKILFSAGYLVIYMGISMLMSYIPKFIQMLFASSSGADLDLGLINGLLSFIPYPFSLSYIFALSIIPFESILWSKAWMILIGFAFTLVCTFFLIRKSIKTLAKQSNSEQKGLGGRNKIKKTVANRIKVIELEKRSYEKAIRSKDLRIISRDFGMIMYLIFPLIMPLMALVLMMGSGEVFETISAMNWMLLIFLIQSVLFLLMAVTGTENDSGHILLTLPLPQFYIYNSKRGTMLTTLFIAIFLPNIVLFFQFPQASGLVLLNLLYGICSVIYLTDYTLALYGFAFGKFRKKYRLEILDQKNKILKAIFIVAGMFGLLFLPLILENHLIYNLYWSPLATVTLKVVYSAIMIVIFRNLALRIFPRPKKSQSVVLK